MRGNTQQFGFGGEEGKAVQATKWLTTEEWVKVEMDGGKSQMVNSSSIF